MLSLNNRLILEQYKKQEIKLETKGGFAQMAHKVSLKPLKVLVDAKLPDGTLIPAGSTAYVREEYLHNNSVSGRTGGMTIPTFSNAEIHPEPFIVIDLINVDVIDVLNQYTIKNIDIKDIPHGMGIALPIQGVMPEGSGGVQSCGGGVCSTRN